MPLQTVLRVDGAALGGEEQAERRRAKLCERLDIPVPEAGGGGGESTPSGTICIVRPEEDVLFALCLVESRAIQTDGVCGALVPLLDHLRISVDE